MAMHCTNNFFTFLITNIITAGILIKKALEIALDLIKCVTDNIQYYNLNYCSNYMGAKIVEIQDVCTSLHEAPNMTIISNPFFGFLSLTNFLLKFW
jgi:hypothetical protein